MICASFKSLNVSAKFRLMKYWRPFVKKWQQNFTRPEICGLFSLCDTDYNNHFSFYPKEAISVSNELSVDRSMKQRSCQHGDWIKKVFQGNCNGHIRKVFSWVVKVIELPTSRTYGSSIYIPCIFTRSAPPTPVSAGGGRVMSLLWECKR